jgi:hypothetical protein
MKPGLKLYKGHAVGRDPREMTPEELRGAGHKPTSPLQALQARCLDCCAGQANEVALCPVVECPAWPFRMGANPWRRPASEGRREAARRSMERINARRRGKAHVPEMSAGAPDGGIAPVFAAGSGMARAWDTRRMDEEPKTVLHRELERRAPGAGTSNTPAPPAEVAK